LLLEAFKRLEAAGDFARTVLRQLQEDRFGKPNIVHHFLRFSDRLLRAGNRMSAEGCLEDGRGSRKFKMAGQAGGWD
jgi:hypothetical protein